MSALQDVRERARRERSFDRLPVVGRREHDAFDPWCLCLGSTQVVEVDHRAGLVALGVRDEQVRLLVGDQGDRRLDVRGLALDADVRARENTLDRLEPHRLAIVQDRSMGIFVHERAAFRPRDDGPISLVLAIRTLMRIGEISRSHRDDRCHRCTRGGRGVRRRRVEPLDQTDGGSLVATQPRGVRPGRGYEPNHGEAHARPRLGQLPAVWSSLVRGQRRCRIGPARPATSRGAPAPASRRSGAR